MLQIKKMEKRRKQFEFTNKNVFDNSNIKHNYTILHNI